MTTKSLPAPCIFMNGRPAEGRASFMRRHIRAVRGICQWRLLLHLTGPGRVHKAASCDGPVAQLVEQLTFNQWVTGSNPVGLTTLFLTVDLPRHREFHRGEKARDLGRRVVVADRDANAVGKPEGMQDVAAVVLVVADV